MRVSQLCFEFVRASPDFAGSVIRSTHALDYVNIFISTVHGGSILMFLHVALLCVYVVDNPKLSLCRSGRGHNTHLCCACVELGRPRWVMSMRRKMCLSAIRTRKVKHGTDVIDALPVSKHCSLVQDDTYHPNNRKFRQCATPAWYRVAHTAIAEVTIAFKCMSPFTKLLIIHVCTEQV